MQRQQATWVNFIYFIEVARVSWTEDFTKEPEFVGALVDVDLTLCQMVFVIIGVEVVSRKHPSSVVDCRIFGICKNRTKQKGYNLHKTKHFDGKAKLKFCILNAANVHQWTPQFMNLKENATAYHKGGGIVPIF